ncbi:hypothetical protein pb186bvf_003910 [Paramecium bursaria]
MFYLIGSQHLIRDWIFFTKCVNIFYVPFNFRQETLAIFCLLNTMKKRIYFIKNFFLQLNQAFLLENKVVCRICVLLTANNYIEIKLINVNVFNQKVINQYISDININDPQKIKRTFFKIYLSKSKMKTPNKQEFHYQNCQFEWIQFNVSQSLKFNIENNQLSADFAKQIWALSCFNYMKSLIVSSNLYYDYFLNIKIKILNILLLKNNSQEKCEKLIFQIIIYL